MPPFRCKPLLDSLLCKYLSQCVKNRYLLILTNLTELFDQSSLIYCADLIQNNLPIFALKLTSNTSRICSPFSSHWSNYNRSNITVHLIW